MKIPNKKQPQQITYNHSSDIVYEELMNLHRNCTAKSYSLLMTDTAHAPDSHLHFIKFLLQRIRKAILKIDDKIKDEELKYDTNREAAKIFSLSSVKIDKYEYLTADDIIPSDQSKMTEQANLTYYLFGKALEKQIKKQVDPLKPLNLSNKIDKLK